MGRQVMGKTAMGWSSYAALAALLCFAAALAGFGAQLGGYTHAQHPVAWLGATGVAYALGFNLLAFVLPGALAAAIALRLRQVLGEGAWSARVGAQLTLLSALAFAAQGLLPLDAQDLDAHASRLHATVWLLWWLAYAAGALAIAFGTHGRAGLQALSRASLIAALAVLLCVLVLPSLLPAGLAQRAAFGAWLLWWWYAARAGVSRI
ncbi:DUF998 domain-containing protein [Lysobacter silvisoli]|nr:DUF998 domain-containing protein [Lysobacter silvisoli]